jgi:hypothetical protein
MTSRDKRFVFIAQIDIRSKIDDAPNISLDEIIPNLKEMINNNKALYERDNRTKIFRLTQYAEFEDNSNNKYFSLLLNKEDINHVKQSYTNKQTNAIHTPSSNEPNDIPSWSVHIIIKKEANPKTPTSYGLLIENIRGVSVSIIRDCLHKLFKEAFGDKKFSIHNTKTTYYPDVRILGHSNMTLQNAIDDGAILKNIDIIKRETIIEGTDTEPYIEEIKDTKSIKLSSLNPLLRIKKYFTKAKEERADICKVLIEFSNKRRETVILDLNEDNPFEQSLILQEKVTDFGFIENTTHTAIHNELVNAILNKCCDYFVS